MMRKRPLGSYWENDMQWMEAMLYVLLLALCALMQGACIIAFF